MSQSGKSPLEGLWSSALTLHFVSLLQPFPTCEGPFIDPNVDFPNPLRGVLLRFLILLGVDAKCLF